MEEFQVELVWNREFDWVPHGERKQTLEDAINYARTLEAMGYGESVKKTRVVDNTGRIRWQYGKVVE